MSKTTEGAMAEGMNDAKAGRPLHSRHASREEALAYIEGYERVKGPSTVYAQRDIEGDELRPHYMRHLDHMTREGLYSKSDIAAELAHRDMLLAQIKEPGHTDNADGSVTIRLAPRSGQLEKIAESVREYLGGSGKVTARQLDGYAEQLLIIADELKAAGK